MKIDKFIANYKNHPVLFIGTGFSLRYLKNSFNWNDLLQHICMELTDNEEIFLDMKSKAKDSSGLYSNEKIATDLETLFNETLGTKESRNGKFKKTNDSFYAHMKEDTSISRFKLYISEILGKIEIKESMGDEITALKEVRKNISSIITTNYDTLIERLFEFTPLIGNDILLSNPYGAIYKIHGCKSQPDKIIITEDDYNEFDKKYELIRAQLLSLFIHNPIIFIGYKIGDKNIKNLLKTIFTYVPAGSEIAEKIKSNFLLVDYKKNSNNVEVEDYYLDLHDNISIKVNSIKTDNFLAIYDALASLELPISTMDIRKVQGAVKEIYEGGKIAVHIIDSMDELKNSEKVLALGTIHSVNYDYQKAGDIMVKYFTIIEEKNLMLIKVIEKYTINAEQFFPIYAFSIINDTVTTIEILKTQQKKKLKTILEKVSKTSRTTHKNIKDIIGNKKISRSSQNSAIVYGILKQHLDLLDVEKHLKDHNDKQSTDYRRMLCAYDFIKYSDDKTL